MQLINNAHLPKSRQNNTDVFSLQSAFPMINKDQEPPFIVFTS